MTFKEAVQTIKDEFPDAIEINSIDAIRQAGLYLYFDGTTVDTPAKDDAHFILLFAGTSFSNRELINEQSPVVESLSLIRKSIFDLSCKDNDVTYGGIKAAAFEGSTLFVYAIKLNIKISV